MAMDLNMQAYNVNDQLFKYEMKMQKSIELNTQFLQKKSIAAGALDGNQKV